MAVDWTEGEIAQIKAAILALASGQMVASVQFADRQVSYHRAQLPELQSLLAVLGVASGASGSRLASFSSGTD